MLLPHERDILLEIDNKNFLCVIPNGFGLNRIIQYHCSFYDNRNSLLIYLSVDQISLKVSQRQANYRKGGIHIVSPRTFLHDLMNHNIESNLISALVITNIEKVKPNCLEPFICFVIRKVNKHCLIKCFSEDAIGLNKVNLDELMAQLFVEKLILLPRFDQRINIDKEINHVKIKMRRQLKEMEICLSEMLRSLKTKKLTRPRELDKYKTNFTEETQISLPDEDSKKKKKYFKLGKRSV